MSQSRCNAGKDLEDDGSSLRLIIDLNIPDTAAEEAQQDNNKNNVNEPPNNQAAGGSSSPPTIDWSSGSVDISDDGHLQFVDRELSPPPEGPDFASAVREAEAAEDARQTVIPDERDVDVNDDDDEDDGIDVVNLWTYYK